MDKMQKWTVVLNMGTNESFSQQICSFANDDAIYASPKEAWDAIGSLFGSLSCRYYKGFDIHSEDGIVEIFIFNDKCVLEMIEA